MLGWKKFDSDQELVLSIKFKTLEILLDKGCATTTFFLSPNSR